MTHIILLRILQIIALFGLMFYGLFLWLGEDHPPFLRTLLLLLTPGAGFGKKGCILSSFISNLIVNLLQLSKAIFGVLSALSI